MGISLEQILETAESLKASDIHITKGASCRYRVNGQLKAVDIEEVSVEDTKNLVTALLTEREKLILEKNGEVTFGHTIEGLGRYRVHILQSLLYNSSFTLFF